MMGSALMRVSTPPLLCALILVAAVCVVASFRSGRRCVQSSHYFGDNAGEAMQSALKEQLMDFLRQNGWRRTSTTQRLRCAGDDSSNDKEFWQFHVDDVCTSVWLQDTTEDVYGPCMVIYIRTEAVAPFVSMQRLKSVHRGIYCSIDRIDEP